MLCSTAISGESQPSRWGSRAIGVIEGGPLRDHRNDFARLHAALGQLQHVVVAVGAQPEACAEHDHRACRDEAHRERFELRGLVRVPWYMTTNGMPPGWRISTVRCGAPSTCDAQERAMPQPSGDAQIRERLDSGRDAREIGLLAVRGHDGAHVSTVAMNLSTSSVTSTPPKAP
jgi:hypothetical protein